MKLTSTGGPGKVTVDIAFVIDSTGSMAPVVNSVRGHLHMILNEEREHSIVSKVKEEYPDLELEVRCASLLFKDYKDDPKFIESHSSTGGHFTKDIESFLQSTEANFYATGGDDQAEDIAGALRKATEWGDWTGQARFLLLFTDAPCHGSDFSAGFTDEYADQSRESMAGFHASFEAAIKNKISVLHCECYPEATEKTHRGMENALNYAIQEAKSAAAGPVPTGGCQPAGPRDSSRYLKRLKLVKDAPSRQPTNRGGLHIVFVLDESGSMSGTPWQVNILHALYIIRQ